MNEYINHYFCLLTKHLAFAKLKPVKEIFNGNDLHPNPAIF
jgi:hypothetical protein